MILYKRIEIDLKKARARVVSLDEDGSPIYNDLEQQTLLSIYDLFEKGDFAGIFLIIEKYPFTSDFLEQDIYDILFDSAFHGTQYLQKP